MWLLVTSYKWESYLDFNFAIATKELMTDGLKAERKWAEIDNPPAKTDLL